jgi:CheY-like chemotaxis protein
VQSALEHLYDHVFLDHHPLVRLVAGAAGRGRGAALHRLLLDAIDRLKPPGDTPTHSPLWRRYRHAVLRYVEGATVAQVADELGVSERQARRDHQDTVQAIAALLGRDSAPPVEAPDRSVSAGERGGLDEELSRVAAAATPLPTPAGELVASIVSTATRLAEDRRVRLVQRVEPGTPPIAAGRTAVRQILIEELLHLIALAAPESLLEVYARPCANGVAVRLLLSGAAAPPTPAPDERHTIATRLAELQGADLVQLGDGAGVELTLPAGRLRTVLLVDDNPGLLRLMRRYLTGVYAVQETQSPEGVLTLALETQPDAVVLDVMMPGVDGWELLQTLRAHPRTRRIPVLICSVLKERELAFSLGASGFVPKPVSQPALLRALEEALLARAG